ncbi:MAG: aminodeoxychorismate synthase component I [Alphaproteobacteria bacterium]|nr:aminodeoxychorismate synthase component I [Alphaproteobacteria bacterium]MBF0250044.1 aminodeoxychorismate synthase component I [Alphaproteobacteria bacterium]
MTLDPPFVLIDDARDGAETLLFSRPLDVIVCDGPQDVEATFERIDAALAVGRHVAGYLAYELGYALETRLAPLMPDGRDGPLTWLGVFDAPARLDRGAVRALMNEWAAEGHAVQGLAAALDRSDYLATIDVIRRHIRDGDVYQINYTFPLDFRLDGSPRALYARLRERQRAGHGAFLDTGAGRILSLSPELFVECRGGRIRTRPMKGTAPRAANPQRDAELARWLGADEKSRAENLMIVDLLRNDLGRVAEIGSVTAGDLFTVETYPTVHQMTSDVEARLRPGSGFADVTRALFPCGSVTGAPKVKAMEIIRALEARPRGVYTGAVGYAGPNGDMRFNVAIRTLDIRPDGRGRMDVGSGVVYDSDPAREWEECHIKARFLTEPPPPAFSLLETLKWTPEDGCADLDAHVRRMAASAHAFAFPFDAAAARRALHDAVATATGPMRVRLLCDGYGEVNAEAAPLTAIGRDGVLRYALSPEPVDPDSPFTYHKTTNRARWDGERARMAHATGCDEVLFLNPMGEVCEGSFTTVFVDRGDGVLLTPPVASGLLPGVLRQALIDGGRAIEAVVRPEDLVAGRLYLGNSVRGLMAGEPV